jgi:hypothetical protein
MKLWELIRNFKSKNGRMPFGRELENLKKMASDIEFREKLIRIPEEKLPPFYEARPTTGPKAEVKQFPKERIVRQPSETTEAGGLEKIIKDLEEMQETGKKYKETTVGDFIADYFDMPKKTTPKKTITELNGVKLYGDETFDELQIIKDTGKHPRNKADGGRIGFKKGFPKIKIKTPKGAREPLKRAAGTYGSGEDLYKILKKEGITMDQAVKEAIDDMPRLSGDTKYDADAVADVMYERLGIDPDTLDQYHLLDVYDNAYQQLVKQKRKSMYQTAAEDSLKKMDPKAETYAKELEYDVQEKISEPGYRGVVTEASDLDDTLKIVESQKSEATKLREKYPGISEALLDKLVKDGNPQRKAEVLAALDEVLTMMDKGMDKDEIIGVLKNTTRTKNQEGGLNTLTDKFNKVGDVVNKYSGMDSLFKLVEYLNTLGTPKGPFRNPFGPKVSKPIDLKKIKRRKKEKSEGLDYLQGF